MGQEPESVKSIGSMKVTESLAFGVLDSAFGFAFVYFLESYNSSTDGEPSRSNLCSNDVITPPVSTLGCRLNHLGGWVRHRQENQPCYVSEMILNRFQRT